MGEFDFPSLCTLLLIYGSNPFSTMFILQNLRYNNARKGDIMDFVNSVTAGANFDPKTRSFTSEELRPQPIIRKRKKVGRDREKERQQRQPEKESDKEGKTKESERESGPTRKRKTFV